MRGISWRLPQRGALALAALIAYQSWSLAADVPFTAGTVVHFADVLEGMAAVRQQDEFIKALSPLDRQLRLQVEREVTEEDFLDFMAAHVQPWEDEDLQKLTPLVERLVEKLRPWKLKLPPVVLLIKTDGKEESGAAYCRGPAILLPQNMLRGPQDRLRDIVTHEFFHVISNHDRQLRAALYAIIGFQPCNEVVLPAAWAARKLANPDAPLIDQYIVLNVSGKKVPATPVTVSRFERYDPARRGGFFAYLDFKLLVLEADGNTMRPTLENGEPKWLVPNMVSSYEEQIGKNTGYQIHPEEILAENFVLLVEERGNLPTPRVVEEMRKVFTQAR